MRKLLNSDRRTKIEIRRAAQVSDGKGGYTDTWSPIYSGRAEVIGQDGREAVIGQALQGVSVYRIRIRWRSQKPRPDDQILYDGQTLNIRSVSDPNGDREQLVILADTGSARNMS